MGSSSGDSPVLGRDFGNSITPIIALHDLLPQNSPSGYAIYPLAQTRSTDTTETSIPDCDIDLPSKPCRPLSKRPSLIIQIPASKAAIEVFEQAHEDPPFVDLPEPAIYSTDWISTREQLSVKSKKEKGLW
jgi:hypothetical protein